MTKAQQTFLETHDIKHFAMDGETRYGKGRRCIVAAREGMYMLRVLCKKGYWTNASTNLPAKDAFRWIVEGERSESPWAKKREV